MSPSIAITIVAWNSLPYFPNLFASLEQQTIGDFKVTVVDNASDDGTANWVQETHPGVAVLRNFRNQGFSRAHNQGIALALSRWTPEELAERYVIVLNPDIELAPNCLETLKAAMDADPTLDICGPKLLRAMTRAEGDDGRRETERSSVIDSTGILIKKSRRAFERGAGEEDIGQYDSAPDVFGISGAFVMLRASSMLALKVGEEYLDEDFFAYKEDLDLAWRARRLGMKVQLIPTALAWHHRRAPSGKQGVLWLSALFARMAKPSYINFLSTRNHLLLGWKNDEFANVFFHLPWIAPYEFGKVAVGIFSPTTWKAWIEALFALPKMRKKRKAMAAQVRVSGKAMRAWFV